MTIPNVETLPTIDLVEREELPEVSCIYFAIDSEGVIQYIGRTINLYNRWQSHHRYQQLSCMSGVRIAYLETAEDLLDDTEAALISHFNPPLNNSKTRRSSNKVAVPEHLLKEIEKKYPYSDIKTILLIALTDFLRK